MRNRQQGITMIGWLILLVPVAIVFYAGVRLTPVYLNYMKVVHSMEQVSSEISASGATQQSIRLAIEKHFNIESVDYPDVKDLKIARANGSWTVEAAYDDQAPLFANLAILVTFDKTVALKGAVGE